MVWVRLDDQFPIHRKIASLSDPAFRLHCAALAWCARNLTDGFVSTGELEQVCAQVRAPAKFAAELVIVRVWHLQDEQCPSEHCIAPHTHDEYGAAVSGWVIHDYLEYQQARSKVVRIRKARAVAGAEGGRRSGETRNRSSKGTRSKNEANAKQVASPSVQPPSRAPTGPRAGGPAPIEGSAAFGDRPAPDGHGPSGPHPYGPGTPSIGAGPPAPQNPAQLAEHPHDPRADAARRAMRAARETPFSGVPDLDERT